MYSGLSGSSQMASPNMSSGPTTQLSTNDKPTMRTLRNTRGSCSYFTLASGGYIIKMRPRASGTFTVPTVK
jgi:hypothetical protein